MPRKKTSSKRTNITKNKKRVSLLTSVKQFIAGRTKKQRRILFAASFGLIGILALVPIFAQGDIPGRADEIVFQLERGATFDQEAQGKDGAITSLQAPFLMRLTGDGTLLCDDGSNVTLSRARISEQAIRKLYDDVMRSGLFDEVDDSITENEMYDLGSYRRISIGNIQYGLHHYTLPETAQGQKVETFEKVAVRLQKECIDTQDVAEKVNKNAITRVKLKANDRSVVQNIFSAIRPEGVLASHKSNHTPGGGTDAGDTSGPGNNNKGGKNKDGDTSVGGDTETNTGGDTTGGDSGTNTGGNVNQYEDSFATDQANRINSHRQSEGIHTLTREACIDKVARDWAYTMAQAGEISHNSDNRTQQVLDSCGRTDWAISAENVGVGGESSNLFNAFLTSICHHANIDGREYIYDSAAKKCYGYAAGSYPGQKKLTSMGVGAYRGADGAVYVTQILWKWANESSNDTNTDPPTTVSYDNATCYSASVSKLIVAPGETFSATVNMQNAGNVAWTLGSSGGTWRLGSSNPRNNTRWGTSRANGNGTVAPGGIATFTFTAQAPSGLADGNYSFNWEMLREGSYWLADQVAEPDGQSLYPVCSKTVTIKSNTSYDDGGGTTTTCPTGSDIICGGRTLYSGNEVLSASGFYKLRVFSNNGEVVLRRNGTTTDYWSSGTASSPVGSSASMQTDGNFVVRTADGKTCHTGTYGNSGAFVKVQDDGKFVIYNSSRSPIWQSNIDGRYGSRWYGGCDNRSAY